MIFHSCSLRYFIAKHAGCDMDWGVDILIRTAILKKIKYDKNIFL